MSLEVTYEESKPSLHARQHGGGVGLEATYEESKQALADDARAPYDHAWKLPNEESKLVEI